MADKVQLQRQSHKFFTVLKFLLRVLQEAQVHADGG